MLRGCVGRSSTITRRCFQLRRGYADDADLHGLARQVESSPNKARKQTNSQLGPSLPQRTPTQGE